MEYWQCRHQNDAGERTGPDEAHQFARNGHDDLGAGELPCAQAPVAGAQPCLGRPGDVGDDFISAAWRRAMMGVSRAGCW